MYKKFLGIIFFISVIFLSSCTSSDTVTNDINIKIGNYSLVISNDFYIGNVNVDSKDIEVLYVYKKKVSNKNFVDSLIIGRYLSKYPVDKSDFFSIILDKLKREIAGVSIVDNGEIKIGKNSLYYVKYKVNDNIFEGSNENVYYGLQAYLLDDTNKEIYVISYLSLEENSINDIFDSIKNLEINE